MNWNTKVFYKINGLVGKNYWLDAFGRAGAEWVVVAMLGWYGVGVYARYGFGWPAVLWPIIFLGGAWVAGWGINILVGLIVREPRPHLTHPDSRLLFSPLMSWKSFPSDHAMSVWLIFFMAVVFQLPWSGTLLFFALWACWGRVFAGVHYPFDILGGFTVAGIVAIIAGYIHVIFV